MWKDVYEEFSELTKSEQMALFNAMKQDLFPDDPDKINKQLKGIREARFASGLGCIYCGSTSVKRNGTKIHPLTVWSRKQQSIRKQPKRKAASMDSLQFQHNL